MLNSLGLGSKELLMPENRLQLSSQKLGGASRIKKSVSKLFEGKNALNTSGTFSPLMKLNIKDILPHKEALRDLKNVVHFTMFQGADEGTISDGESFKIMKHNLNSSEASHTYLEVLDSNFDMNTIRRFHESVKQQPATAAQTNKFFKPLDDRYSDNDFLVG